MDINIEDIKKTYKLLGHKEETELRCIEANVEGKKKVISIFINNEKDFVDVCKKYNGKLQVYTGVNERTKKGTFDKDVKSIGIIPIDIDPVRPKDTSSTKEQLTKAKEIAEKIREYVLFKGYEEPSMALSGNGYQLWFRVNNIDPKDKDKIKLFEEELRNEFQTDEIKIDSIHNPSRIMKVIGVLSIKGKDHRLSKWDYYDGRIDENITNYVLGLEPKVKEIIQPAEIISDEKTKNFFKKDEKLKNLYEGKLTDKYDSKSEAEASLVSKFVYYKIPKKQIFELMKDCKIGKWNTTTEDYRELTYLKATQYHQKVEKDDILELLNEPDKIIQYLDLGEAKDKWYYAFKVRGKSAIITSEGEVLRDKREKVKEGNETINKGYNDIWNLFNYNGYIGEIAPTISKETIKRFYLKKGENNLVKPKEIYKTIRDKLNYYMDFGENDEIADVLTCWIIATYCYPLFYWFPHILINAPSKSGKTKCADILIELGFRGFDLGASGGVSPPQIFRTLEGNRGTMKIDEFEQTKGKQKSDTQQLVNQILNASPTRDSYVIRVEKSGGKWIAKKFPINAPKIACNISGINATSLSRYIAFKWLKTKTIKGKRKPYRKEDKESFKPIREDSYILILENWEKIKDIYDTLEIDLTNREEDNWLPLFAIAKFIDDEVGEDIRVEDKLNKYLETYKELEIQTDDPEEDFFNALLEVINEEPTNYTPKELSDVGTIGEIFSYLKSPAHKIGSILTAYKFKSNRGGGKKKYLLSKKSVKEIRDLYFKRSDDEEKKKEEEET